MATPKYTALATLTLSSAAATVTFGSIPAGYRDLQLIINASNTTTDSGTVTRVNGDSGSNYTNVFMRGTGSSALSGSGTATNIGGVDNYVTAGAMGTYEFFDYSATDKHKTVLVRGGIAVDDTKAYAVRWANTAAITSIVLTPSGGSFAIGSTFDLFGVK